jgi:beta-phosphoglucomutase-like phosphatase (HAD superfamily)
MVDSTRAAPAAATMNEALIFDCDGTLADTMPIHHRVWLDVLRPLGATFPEDRFYALGGTPTRELARLLITENGLTIDPAELLARKEAAFLARVGEVQPLEKVVAVARAGRRQVPMAVGSGGCRHVVELTLRQIGVLDWFDAVVAAEDTPRHKPEPDVFLEAARRLGAPPGVCTVYEDTDLGIEAARRAGMRFVDVRVL